MGLSGNLSPLLDLLKANSGGSPLPSSPRLPLSSPPVEGWGAWARKAALGRKSLKELL